MSHCAQKPGDLAAMVGPVIHHVQRDLPQRRLVGIAFQVFIRNIRPHGIIGQPRGPLLPSFKKLRPVIFQD